MSLVGISSSNESIFHGVTHRNTRGILILSEFGLLFRTGENLDTTTSKVDVESDKDALSLPWNQVDKHQVSPVSHPKCLLKILCLQDSHGPSMSQSSSHTFQFLTRSGLESARKDISIRLAKANNSSSDHNRNQTNYNSSSSTNGKKRFRDDSPDMLANHEHSRSSPPSATFISHDPIALAATRSSLLASDPALRAQHRLLVVQNETLTEEDFWETHKRLVADEYAKISAKVCKGMSSDIKSSLDLGIVARGTATGRRENASSATDTSGARLKLTENNEKKSSSAAQTSTVGGVAGGGDSKRTSSGGNIAPTIRGRGIIVHLGVEEIRQIFLMYPAVHKAYEEKVPLELSEEQFWRKYLESEYFHRDRGRVGVHIGKVNERERMEMERLFGKKGMGSSLGNLSAADKTGESDKKEKKDDMKQSGVGGAENGIGDDEAKSRLAAAGTDDIFSRYDRGAAGISVHRSLHQLKTNIAIGQFDLVSTAEAERGERYLQGLDLHPPTESGESRGARVIDKYNRHWAIILHPNKSTASGVNMAKIADISERRCGLSLPDNEEDAKVNGGIDCEMNRLIGFANASENNADHSRGIGEETEDCLELVLNNIGAYTGEFFSSCTKETNHCNDPIADSDILFQYTKYLAVMLQAETEPLLQDKRYGDVRGFCNAPALKKLFPEPKIGRGLLEALTKKMVADSQMEEDVQRLADSLHDEFRSKLASYFRQSSDLLRHFFSLRSVFCDKSEHDCGIKVSESQKKRLENIVHGMQKVHGEMYELTRSLPLMESKMFKPIMDQLDWAFKLHREDSSKGGRGGFVTVSRGGFVPVELS